MLNRKVTIGVSVPVMALALSATASFANSNEGTVTADALNVRSGPSTSYSITTKLYKGDKVEILETSNGWHKIKASNGKIGWVSGDYIKVSSGSTSQTSYKATVTATSLNVRSGAGTSYSVITKLSKGTVVDVIESASNGWKKIKTSGGTTGWVSGDYLTTGSAGNSSTNNSTSQTSYKATVNTDSLNINTERMNTMPRVKKLHVVVRIIGTDYVINDLGPGKSPRFELYNEKTKTVVQKSNNPLLLNKYVEENVYAESSETPKSKKGRRKLTKI